MMRITIVAIGPDGPEHLTEAAVRALEDADSRLLRTGRHGVATWLSEKGFAYETLDALYEQAGDFDELNARAADAVQAAAGAGAAFCFAVSDPLIDGTVELLRARGADLRVIPGVTLEACARAAALEAGLAASGVIVSVAATDFAAHRMDPAAALLVSEVGSALVAGEVKLRLLDLYPPQMEVLFAGRKIPLHELDRQVKYSHLSYVYIPRRSAAERSRYTFGDLLDVMARLRRPGDGCPWDIEQTHETLRQYVIEEAYEVVEAIDQNDMERIADELGDVLLQVVFHAQVAKEHGEFDITDVTTAICHKMITRHAHIFGDIVCETPEDVLRSWEAIKKKEKGLRATTEVMRDVPGHLPALMRAGKVQNKARQVGFDWDNPSDALMKVHEELGEVRADLAAGRDTEEEYGDLLFAVVNAARLSGVQPELALGQATEKFIRRFEKMEHAIASDGKQMRDMDLAAMDAYWDRVKREEKERT